MNTKSEPSSQHIDKVKLLKLMDGAFGLADLRTLCFSLDIDFENITGENKHEKIRYLIIHCARRGLLGELLNWCQEERENINWYEGTVTVATRTMLPSKPEALEEGPKSSLKSTPKSTVQSEDKQNPSKRSEPKPRPNSIQTQALLGQPKNPPAVNQNVDDEVFAIFESQMLSIIFTAGWMIIGGLTAAFFWDSVWITLICIAIGASVGLLQLAINWGSSSLADDLEPFVQITVFGASLGFSVSLVSGIIWGMVVAELPEVTLAALWEATKVTFSTALQVIVGGTVLGAVAFPIGMILVFGLLLRIEEKVSSKSKS